jgi:4'-phosphopantetheinyl transferase
MPRAAPGKLADSALSRRTLPRITVACVRLGLEPRLQERYAGLLPAEMRAAMRRFARPRDREAYLLGRLTLLELLRERGLAADSLARLDYGERGKPLLAGAEFNISHSGSFVLCAVSDDGPVGVDIERVRPLDVDELATFFSAAQWRTIVAAADPHRQFFTLWTQLESVLKADGGGLGIAASEIVLERLGARLDGVLWHLHPLAVHPSYAAHLATRDPRPTVELRRLRAEAAIPSILVAPAVEQ